MKIYGVKFIDYLGEDDRIIDYFINKEKAKEFCDKVRQERKDDYGIYIVKEIEVKE